MSNISAVRKRLPFENKHVLLVEDHTTGDIVNAIKKNHGKYRGEYDSIADVFKKESPERTARELFSFLKKNVRYDVEPDHYQTVKTPGAIVYQKHGDCKHYASFINGVCCSLERNGYPVHSRYRFVSDTPGRDIHHVFAVVTDTNTGKEYWVDPVLKTFDQRIKFHNVKDYDMSKIGELYAISGVGDYGAEATYPGGPSNLPQVWGIGKKKKNNIFKKIAHGMQVNAANIKKGIKVNTANIKHGMDVNLANAKTLALKVSMAPARNAFMALIDLNAFNLATRLADSWNDKVKNQQIVNKWKALGGDPNKLKNAINNGLKHKAFHHHQQAKKINGLHTRVNRRGGLQRHHSGHPMRVYHPNYTVRTLHEAYAHPYDDRGNLPKVSGIGEPISTAALVALATALIGAFGKFLKPSHKDDQEMASMAKEGVSNMVVNASDAMDMTNAGPDTRALMNQAVTPGSGINVTAGIDSVTGQPTLQVNDVNHPQLTRAGTTQPYNIPDEDQQAGGNYNTGVDPDPQALVNVPHNVGKDFMRDVIGPIKSQVAEIWEGYKVPILFLVGGVAVYKIATRRKKGKRR